MSASAIFALALAASGPGVLQDAAARHLGGKVYLPDDTAPGYVLANMDKGTVDGRPVVRLTFSNAAKKDCFDLVEYVPAPKLDLTSAWKAVIKSGAVPVRPMDSDTVVVSRRAEMDVALVAGIVSPGTAKRIVDRLVVRTVSSLDR